jgi:hypothetical protein
MILSSILQNIINCFAYENISVQRTVFLFSEVELIIEVFII